MLLGVVGSSAGRVSITIVLKEVINRVNESSILQGM